MGGRKTVCRFTTNCTRNNMIIIMIMSCGDKIYSTWWTKIQIVTALDVMLHPIIGYAKKIHFPPIIHLYTNTTTYYKSGSAARLLALIFLVPIWKFSFFICVYGLLIKIFSNRSY